MGIAADDWHGRAWEPKGREDKERLEESRRFTEECARIRESAMGQEPTPKPRRLHRKQEFACVQALPE